MKKAYWLILFIMGFTSNLYAQNTGNDSLTRKQFVHIQTAKADSLNQIALALASPGAEPKDLRQAIEYIMKGLHVYSKFRDTAGLRQTFNNLGMVYHLQKKYVQAKWFTIQSNSLAREQNDTLGIIHSLLNLSSVKADMKDYDLAERDLKDAVDLAKTQHGIDLQIEVQKSYIDFYTKQGDEKHTALAMNRIMFLKDSVAKADENQKLALLKKQDEQRTAQQTVLKQKQLALQKEDSRLQSLLQQKRNITTTTVLIIAVLTLLCFYFLLRRRRRKKRRSNKNV